MVSVNNSSHFIFLLKYFWSGRKTLLPLFPPTLFFHHFLTVKVQAIDNFLCPLMWCRLSTFVYTPPSSMTFNFNLWYLNSLYFPLLNIRKKKYMKGGWVKSILWVLDTCTTAARMKFPWLLSERIVQIVVKIRIGTPDYVWVWQMKKEMFGIFICSTKLTQNNISGY